MKFILLLAVVIGVVWLMRSMRKPPLPPQGAPAPGGDAPRSEDMVTCAQCGVHLPRSEAFPGRGGVFCSEAHRSVFEGERSR